jgi:hypothetical protein
MDTSDANNTSNEMTSLALVTYSQQTLKKFVGFSKYDAVPIQLSNA